MADNNTALGLAVLALGGSSGGGEPAAYIKNASVSGNELTLTKKDDTTVVYEPEVPSYTAGAGIDITDNVIKAQAPKLVFTVAQVVSQNPITLQLTNEQAALIEDEQTICLEFDLTGLGMSKNYWKKMYISSSDIRLDCFVDEAQTHGMAVYNSSNKQLVYSTTQLQPKLIAGSNITIAADGKTISAAGGAETVNDNFYRFATGTSNNAIYIGRPDIALPSTYPNNWQNSTFIGLGTSQPPQMKYSFVSGGITFNNKSSNAAYFDVVIGHSNALYGYRSSTDYSQIIGGGNNSLAPRQTLIGEGLIGSSYNQTVVGRYNARNNWAADTEYNVGDIVVYMMGGYSLWGAYRCKTAHTSTSSFDSSKWDAIGNGSSKNYSDKIFIVGNGTDSAHGSDAFTVDNSGNVVAQGAVTATNIPEAPSTDGNYVLKCSIVDGVKTFSWEAQA